LALERRIVSTTSAPEKLRIARPLSVPPQQRVERPRGRRVALDRVVRGHADTDNHCAFTRAVAGHLLDQSEGVLRADGRMGHKHTLTREHGAAPERQRWRGESGKRSSRCDRLERASQPAAASATPAGLWSIPAESHRVPVSAPHPRWEPLNMAAGVLHAAAARAHRLQASLGHELHESHRPDAAMALGGTACSVLPRWPSDLGKCCGLGPPPSNFAIFRPLLPFLVSGAGAQRVVARDKRRRRRR
jgi:hypothetical protein